MPDLLIIDFDPAFRGLTEFLYRLREFCPGTRVLIIGARVPKQITTEFRSLGALHFVGKPFEILDFGAAVQALLEAPSIQGNLASLGLADVALAQCVGERKVVLTVKGKNGHAGEIHISGGQVAHATAGKHRDVDALAEMFGWSKPAIREVERRKIDKRTLREEWAELFLDAVRRAAARNPASPPTPPPALEVAAPVQPPARSGKKIVVVDDTEMLLIFVEDALLYAEPDLQITTAPNGMLGVEKVSQVLPDLVLLDYSLPDINGDEVCRRLLENEKTAQIPIIMMSGHVAQMTATAERFDNVVTSIPKPFLSEALVTLVQKTLKGEIRRSKKAPKPPPPVQERRPAPAVTETVAVSPPPEAAPKPVEPPVPVPVSAPEPPPLVMPQPVEARIPAPANDAPPLAMPKPLAPAFAPDVPPRPAMPPPLPAPPAQAVLAETKMLPVPAAIKDGNEVVLGLFLQVVSMQLTPSLRMGSIRAKPSSFTVSLHASPAVRAAFPAETGFELGRIDLDANGRIATVRLIPTLQAVQRMPTRNALQIGALDVVPHDSSKHVQLTPSQSAPMMMHLLAHLELAGVELSTNFQVAQLICRNRSNTVRVTLNSEAAGQEQTGVFCETAAVKLDATARIAELLLRPLK